MFSFMPAGRVSFSRATSSRAALESSSGLAVDCRVTPILMAGLPLKRDRIRSLAAAISTLETSRSRTGYPFTLATITSSNWAGVCKSVAETTENSRARDSMRPAGISTFWLRSAASTSCTVRP